MSRTILWALPGALFLASVATGGEIYRCVDAAGNAHYSDDRAILPRECAAKAERTRGADIGVLPSAAVTASAPADKEATPSASSGQAPATPHLADKPLDAAVSARAAADREAAAEQAWRQAFRDAKDRIARLDKLIERDKEILEHPDQYGYGFVLTPWGWAPNRELERVREKFAEREVELASAKAHLADLEHEASGAAIPREWRR